MDLTVDTILGPLQHGQRERESHLSSHTGLERCCQDIPWQKLEAYRVAYNNKIHTKQEDTNERHQDDKDSALETFAYIEVILGKPWSAPNNNSIS